MNLPKYVVKPLRKNIRNLVRALGKSESEDADGYYDVKTRQEFYDIITEECDNLTSLIKNLLELRDTIKET